MAKLDRWLVVLVAAVIGTAAGVVVTSLILSAYYMSTGQLSWHELGDIADFWNGHLAVAAFFILGTGLFLQARAEREQLLRYRKEYLQSFLVMLSSRLAELERHVRAYHIDSQQEPPKVRRFVGVREVAAAITASGAEPSDEFDVWVDLSALNAYASAAEQLRDVQADLRRCSEHDHVPNTSYLYVNEILQYAIHLRKSKNELLVQLKSSCPDGSVIETITVMLDQGWRLELNSIHERHYLTAKLLLPLIARVEELSSGGCMSVREACERLILNWKATWRDDARERFDS